jgi:hypothetical protein
MRKILLACAFHPSCRSFPEFRSRGCHGKESHCSRFLHEVRNNLERFLIGPMEILQEEERRGLFTELFNESAQEYYCSASDLTGVTFQVFHKPALKKAVPQ